MGIKPQKTFKRTTSPKSNALRIIQWITPSLLLPTIRVMVMMVTMVMTVMTVMTVMMVMMVTTTPTADRPSGGTPATHHRNLEAMALAIGLLRTLGEPDGVNQDMFV